MRTAIITGASRGLGHALAASLAGAGAGAGAGWRLVVDARDPDALRAAAGSLSGGAGSGPDRIVAIAGDVTDDGHQRALVAAAGTRLDLLVLNASSLGQTPLPPLAGYDAAALRAAFEVNTVAPLRLVQHALPALRAAAGRIVAVSSDAAVEAYQGWGGYGASKAALEALARVLAVEEPGLRVYAVDPGDMRTAMHQDAYPGQDISDRPEPESVVPAIRRLIDGDLPSGRYTAAQLARVPA